MYSTIGVAFAARKCEIFDFQFDQIKATTTSDGTLHYEVQFQRAKAAGPIQGPMSQVITGDFEVKAITNYVNCFPVEERTGRFFRKLLTNPDGTVKFSKRVIGEHTAAKIGIFIAKLLNLSEPENYTGHCWRRTATTFAANAGLPLPQIKALTGHKSDTVVQGYIDRSAHMQNVTAQAVAISSSSSSSSTTSKRVKIDNDISYPSYNINVNVSGTFSGNMSLFSSTKADQIEEV